MPDPELNLTLPLAHLQHAFLSILPYVESHGRVYFRHLKCAVRKEEAIAEMVALAWRWHLRLAQKGKDATQFPTALASFAARAVRNGRKLCGQDRAKDVLSSRAQRLKSFTTAPLPAGSALNGNVFDEALIDNTRSEVPEQVAFRCDFPAWRLTRTDRHRRLIDDLMVGERTLDLAKKYGLSPARISQLRREFHADWRLYCGGCSVHT